MAVALAIVAAITSTTPAHNNDHLPMLVAAPHHQATCTKAFTARIRVIAKHGRRAPGRNICRHNVLHTDATITAATPGQKVRYLRQLRLLITPVSAFLTIRAGPPAQLPAGTLTAHITAEPSVLASCIIRNESGGDPQANNGSHFGIAQWDIRTWLAHGGGRYASSPLGATYAQQLSVLLSALSRFGCSAWCPYDPC